MSDTREARRELYATFEGCFCAAGALAFAAGIAAADALDMLTENRPDLLKREVKKVYNRIVGGRGTTGFLAMHRQQVNTLLAGSYGRDWLSDFGTSVYGAIEDRLQKFRFAVANALGRYPEVPDINICAAVLVACLLSDEAEKYCERCAASFSPVGIKVRRTGERMSGAAVFGRLNPHTLCHELNNMAHALLGRALSDDEDLMQYPDVKAGAKSMINTLCDVETWRGAREKADQYNSGREKDNKQ